MATVVAAPLTTAQFLALPEDGKRRELIRGCVRERALTIRSRRHSQVMAAVATTLKVWRDAQPEPRGAVVCGEAGVRLARDPDTVVGLDVAYLAAEIAPHASDSSLIEGPPTLAVEILSPSETQHDIHEKLSLLLDFGVRVVGVIDPELQTVTVVSASKEPELFNRRHSLAGDPWLPGFSVDVRRLFE